MANPEHLKILQRGVVEWNMWRAENPHVWLDLFAAHLGRANLIGADLSRANLSRANLIGANLMGADLSDSILMGADLNDAVLSQATLSRAELSGAVLSGADLGGADLSGAELGGATLNGVDLSGADLSYSVLSGATLDGADFTGAIMGDTSFGDIDLSRVRGLESVRHYGPSSVGIDTVYKSRGEIPEVFLRGCGVPEDFITYMRSLVVRPIQFYSCFISYSTRDEEFARRLYSRMRDEGLRVWFAPEEMKGGQKLHEQIDRAIQVHDKLLLILSEESMRSEWVLTEIRRARRTEVAESRRKLFPIAIVDFDKVRTWERFDADTGRDLAREVREYFIPDFSNWKDHDAFEAAFKRLLRDLKAEGEG